MGAAAWCLRVALQRQQRPSSAWVLRTAVFVADRSQCIVSIALFRCSVSPSLCLHAAVVGLSLLQVCCTTVPRASATRRRANGRRTMSKQHTANGASLSVRSNDGRQRATLLQHNQKRGKSISATGRTQST